MAVVLSVIWDATSLARKSADEVGVGYTSCLEFLIEKCSPAALPVSMMLVYEPKLRSREMKDRTGEPVMLSPRALILTVADNTGLISPTSKLKAAIGFMATIFTTKCVIATSKYKSPLPEP